MLYRIKPATINKIVGSIASVKMRDDYAPEISRAVSRMKQRGKLDILPDLNGIEIQKRARANDIIICVPLSKRGILISPQLKRIVDSFLLPQETQWVEATATHYDQSYKYHYFYNYESPEKDLIDWDRSKFMEVNYVGKPKSEVQYSSSLKEIEQLRKNKVVRIDTPKLLYFKTPIKYDFFRLVYSTPGYFVSERLKNAIEESDCEGIELTPITELGFDVVFE